MSRRGAMSSRFSSTVIPGGRTVERVLEHPADMSRALVLDHLGHVHVADLDAALMRKVTPAIVFSSVLSRAVRPHHRHQLAIAQRQRDAPQNPHLVDRASVEGDVNVFEADHVRAAWIASGRGITSARRRGTAGATMTISDVTSRMSVGPSPMNSAPAITPR